MSIFCIQKNCRIKYSCQVTFSYKRSLFIRREEFFYAYLIFPIYWSKSPCILQKLWSVFEKAYFCRFLRNSFSSSWYFVVHHYRTSNYSMFLFSILCLSRFIVMHLTNACEDFVQSKSFNHCIVSYPTETFQSHWYFIPWHHIGIGNLMVAVLPCRQLPLVL